MARRRIAALCAAALLAACSEQRAPDADWPEGVLLSARRAALVALLGQLESLDGTPLARWAASFALPRSACEVVEARVGSGDWRELPSALACAKPDGALAPLHAARGDADLAFALPVAGDADTETRRLLGNGRVRGDEVSLDLHWPDALSGGGLALLLPGEQSAGPALLAGRERLLHARVRPAGGLDVAALVPADSQADRLFRLRSDLLSGAVLDGTWEGAVYLPEPGQGMPRVALALGFRLERAARAAAERLVANLTSTWPVRPSPIAVGDAAGTCLLDLNIMPEFAPCYVTTPRALVLGWNPQSLRAALAPDAAPVPVDPEPARLVVELGRIREADARLRAVSPAAVADVQPVSWPWRRLVARGRGADDGVRVQLTLEGSSR